MPETERTAFIMTMTRKALLQTVLSLLCLVTRAQAFAGRGTAWKQRTDASLLRMTSSSSSGDTLSLFSPCKINLFLRIIRKRDDGFHDLASLFQAVGFGDTLELTAIDGDQDEFSCNMEGVPVDSTNLVLRALQLMREKTDSQQHFKANLIKQVPAQAGLGGGSANAATAMWGANELMGKPASLEQVCVCLLFLLYNVFSIFIFHSLQLTN